MTDSNHLDRLFVRSIVRADLGIQGVVCVRCSAKTFGSTLRQNQSNYYLKGTKGSEGSLG